jgi:hypothetical protein
LCLLLCPFLLEKRHIDGVTWAEICPGPLIIIPLSCHFTSIISPILRVLFYYLLERFFRFFCTIGNAYMLILFSYLIWRTYYFVSAKSQNETNMHAREMSKNETSF